MFQSPALIGTIKAQVHNNMKMDLLMVNGRPNLIRKRIGKDPLYPISGLTLAWRKITLTSTRATSIARIEILAASQPATLNFFSSFTSIAAKFHVWDAFCFEPAIMAPIFSLLRLLGRR